MSLDEAQSAKVKNWIAQAIDWDYAARMSMPSAQQEKEKKHFNADINWKVGDFGFLAFADGVAAFKRHVALHTVNDGSDLTREYREGLAARIAHGGMRREDVTLDLAEFEQRYEAINASARLKTAAITAQTGFKDMTSDEYEALQQDAMPSYHIPRESQKILASRPLALLKQLDEDGFRAMVGEVLLEHHLPAELPALATRVSNVKLQGKAKGNDALMSALEYALHAIEEGDSATAAKVLQEAIADRQKSQASAARAGV